MDSQCSMVTLLSLINQWCGLSAFMEMLTKFMKDLKYRPETQNQTQKQTAPNLVHATHDTSRIKEQNGEQTEGQ
ncbi:unnamed protein product [Sphenostylis stenocarpa]|uniref:Uncharacterized protein n=1 Tax=Sphenostylis stenocarpa TaxID=92480 RepID=A0AA86W126_9FABA|nr:unnamed protein product [Sphenostylis stenocarpa]